MRSPKNLVIAILAVTTAGGGALAWQQYQELIALRASAMSNDERADWQKRLWAAEKRRHELEESLAAVQAGKSESKGDEEEPGVAVADANPGGGRRRGPNLERNFFGMMEKPEIQKLMALQQRGALDAHYASLFKSLNLSPDQLEKFKSLLVEKQTAMTDVLAAARAQGITPRSPEFRQLLSDTQADIDASIKATLGETAFTQYQQYQQTIPQRNTVNQLQQALSYTNTPLSSTQADQMIQILAANSPTGNGRANTLFMNAGGLSLGGVGPSAPINETAIAQAQGVLAPAQLQALQQLQQAQAAQAQLSAAMRRQFGGQVNNVVPGVSIPAPVTTRAKPGG